MQYAMLFYLDEKRWSELSKEEKNQIHRDCGAWHEELVKAGKTVSAMALQPISTGFTVRQKKGKNVITDGPFAETKEVLGGLEIVECQNLDEAKSIARRFPALRAGSLVEVRPLVIGECCES